MREKAWTATRRGEVGQEVSGVARYADGAPVAYRYVDAGDEASHTIGWVLNQLSGDATAR